jgi:iodotyrosine deiodinase
VFARKTMNYKPLPLPDRMELCDDDMLAEAKAFLARMKRRHSVRDYDSRPVPREVIEDCIRAAGTAPSGANHQPWHFVAIGEVETKRKIRAAAEEEERKFYAGAAGDAWLKALEPIGTNEQKPHLEEAPWLIVIFAQRWGEFDDGTRYKHYYVPESTGIATGFLITALHHAGLVCLTHTPNPMRFLNDLLGRPDSEKPIMILAVGHAAEHATVPAVAKIKKPIEAILSVVD